MSADPIERLSTLFERFPGIGPRQAQRFVQFLLRSSSATRRELMESVRDLASSVHQCASCFRFHSLPAPRTARQAGDEKDICLLCSNPSRDQTLLAIVASDADLLALERSNTYRGRYFVLGGTISLATEKTNNTREKELLHSISARRKAGLAEVILALPVNPEGNFTALHVRDSLSKAAKEYSFKITALGRGLSTGSELEYADPETLKNALENRH